MIKGITVILTEKTQTGRDDYGRPIFSEQTHEVENVLVGEPSAEDIEKTESIYSRHAVYTLAIPKGDEHSWANAVVELPAPFAGKYRTIGVPTAGIEANIPLLWNMKVQVERYE